MGGGISTGFYRSVRQNRISCCIDGVLWLLSVGIYCILNAIDTSCVMGLLHEAEEYLYYRNTRKESHEFYCSRIFISGKWSILGNHQISRRNVRGICGRNRGSSSNRTRFKPTRFPAWSTHFHVTKNVRGRDRQIPNRDKRPALIVGGRSSVD